MEVPEHGSCTVLVGTLDGGGGGYGQCHSPGLEKGVRVEENTVIAHHCSALTEELTRSFPVLREYKGLCGINKNVWELSQSKWFILGERDGVNSLQFVSWGLYSCLSRCPATPVLCALTVNPTWSWVISCNFNAQGKSFSGSAAVPADPHPCAWDLHK